MVDLQTSVLIEKSIPQRFSLYEIYGLAGGVDDEQFDKSVLPFDVTEGVRIEDISSLLRSDTFEFVKERMGSDAVKQLRGVTHALVHRYSPESYTDAEGNWIGDEAHSAKSGDLVRNVAACLRLIRPMRQSAQLMWGGIRADGTFDVLGFDSPVECHEVPYAHRFFHLRNVDALELRRYAPPFLRAMR